MFSFAFAGLALIVNDESPAPRQSTSPISVVQMENFKKIWSLPGPIRAAPRGFRRMNFRELHELVETQAQTPADAEAEQNIASMVAAAGIDPATDSWRIRCRAGVCETLYVDLRPVSADRQFQDQAPGPGQAATKAAAQACRSHGYPAWVSAPMGIRQRGGESFFCLLDPVMENGND